MTTLTIFLVLAGLAGGGAIGYVYRRKIVEEKQKDVVDKSKKMMQEATTKAKEMLLEAKNDAFKIQEEAKVEERKKREQLSKTEERLVKKEEALDRRTEGNEKIREELEVKVESIKELKEKVQAMYQKQEDELSKITSLSKEEAKELLLKKVEEESKEDIIEQIKRTEKALKDEAENKAKSIIADAIQKYAAETAVESTATIVDLPNDEMKGRIIGREGRNINTFEQITGIDVIVDDTPGSIVISGFDLIRRYVAKVALTRLIEDGRIHPARIEETVEKTIGEVNKLVKELGEKAVYDTGVVGLHPDLVKILGRLKFRSSNNQNVLKHSMEVAFLASAIASELKADVDVCLKAGLLHDIGKAVNHEVQGFHANIGGDIAKKYGLSDAVVHAIYSHHGDPEPETVEAKILQAANLISNARPGANKDNLDNYVKRMNELENTASSFDGVRKAYAIQAGNEVRVFVEPEIVDDLQSIKLSHEIVKKIERDLNYPGQIKVDVLRETRAEEFAK